MGGAFAGIADDPSALVVNSAGLTNVTALAFLSTIIHPYELSDLEESYLAAVFPVRIGTAGISWHRLALEGAVTEDLITIGFARDYIRTSQDASLSFGGTLDIARVAYGYPIGDSEAALTGSLGVLLRPFPIIGIGYCVRNINEPHFDFTGTGGTELGRTHVWSLAYKWNDMVAIVLDRMKEQGGVWETRLGIEIEAPAGIRLRSGVREKDLTFGAGITISRFELDVGMDAHEVLGVSYILSMGYMLPTSGDHDEN